MLSIISVACKILLVCFSVPRCGWQSLCGQMLRTSLGTSQVWPGPHLSLSQPPQRQLNLFDRNTVIIIYLQSGGNQK